MYLAGVSPMEDGSAAHACSDRRLIDRQHLLRLMASGAPMFV
jgi:hypothetical protein